jgi:hypothetical protein
MRCGPAEIIVAVAFIDQLTPLLLPLWAGAAPQRALT